MRVVAIVLPELALEAARSLPDAARPVPRGVVLASRKGMLASELTGNVRLHAVCEKARALGITPGQTLAAARACVAELAVQIVTEEALALALARVAEASLAFGATVSFARGDAGDDTVWVDVTGCAHLFTESTQSVQSTCEADAAEARDARELVGEGRLLARLAGQVRELGHTCRVALAGGPRVARAVASYGARPACVVPIGGDRQAIGELPIEALPLEPAQCVTMRRLGVASVFALARLPRAALGARLGARAAEVMQLLEGDDRAPLDPYVPRQAPAETLELEHGTDALEALTFVVKTLTSRLALRLEGRGVGAVKLSLDLKLDARLEHHEGGEALHEGDDAHHEGGDDGKRSERRSRSARTTRTLTLNLPTPISNATELFVVLRARLERTLLPAPVLALTLRADECRPRIQVPQSLFEPQASRRRGIPLLVAELAAELGEGAVGRLTLGDSWRPHERSLLVPFFAPPAARAPHVQEEPSPSPQASPEPSLLLPEPIPVERRLVSAFRFVARHESLGWWRKPTASMAPHDVVAATVEGRTAIVEIDKASNAAKILGWLD